jgi:hypothetical protein
MNGTTFMSDLTKFVQQCSTWNMLTEGQTTSSPYAFFFLQVVERTHKRQTFLSRPIFNVYRFYHQCNNCLLTNEALYVSTLQVLHVSHTRLLNCNNVYSDLHTYGSKKKLFSIYIQFYEIDIDSNQNHHSLTHSWSWALLTKPSTGPYPESDHCSAYHPILSKIHFNTIHPPTSWSS